MEGENGAFDSPREEADGFFVRGGFDCSAKDLGEELVDGFLAFQGEFGGI